MLDYFNALCAGINQLYFSRLKLVQNPAARFLMGRRRGSISPLFYLHWLSVKFTIEYKVLTFVFKALHGLATVYISDLLCPYSPRRSLRSSSENLFTVPLSCLKSKGDRAFSVLAPKLWNLLPQSVRLSQTKTQIKLRWALFVTYTIVQSIMRSEMCSLHLTHPSAHTPGAVGSQHCGARGAVGGSVPCSRVSPQSWTLPARARIRTHNLGLSQVSSPTFYPLGHTFLIPVFIWFYVVHIILIPCIFYHCIMLLWSNLVSI